MKYPPHDSPIPAIFAFYAKLISRARDKKYGARLDGWYKAHYVNKEKSIIAISPRIVDYTDTAVNMLTISEAKIYPILNTNSRYPISDRYSIKRICGVTFKKCLNKSFPNNEYFIYYGNKKSVYAEHQNYIDSTGLNADGDVNHAVIKPKYLKIINTRQREINKQLSHLMIIKNSIDINKSHISNICDYKIYVKLMDSQINSKPYITALNELYKYILLTLSANSSPVNKSSINRTVYKLYSNNKYKYAINHNMAMVKNAPLSDTLHVLK